MDSHPLYSVFKSLPSSISASVAVDLQNEARESIVKHIQPAFRKLKDFIKNTYMPHTRQHVGVWNLPNGPQFYQQCLNFHTTTNFTAADIHEMGLKEVDRIETQMREVRIQIPYNTNILTKSVQ